MRRLSIKLAPSKEEKCAMLIGKMLSDFTLDLEAIGRHLALSNPHIIYTRAVEVLEATKYNKTVSEYRERGKYYGEQTR